MSGNIFFLKFRKLITLCRTVNLRVNNDLRAINSATNFTLQPFVEREICNLFNALLKTALTCFRANLSILRVMRTKNFKMNESNGRKIDC